MKIKNLSLLVIFVLVLSMVFLVACGSDSNSNSSNTVKTTEKKAEETKKSPVTIKLVTGGDLPSAGLEDMLMLYEEKTGNKVENQVMPAGNDYETVLRTRIATKDFPDATYFFATSSHYSWLNAKENLIDLTNEQCAKDMTEVVRKSFTWTDGKVYGTALGGTNFIGVVYNKVVFENAGITGTPKNYADFLNICETLKSKGILPIYEAAKDAWPVQIFTLSGWSSLVEPFIGQEGIDKLNTNKLKVTEIPQVTDMFKRQVELKDKGYLNEDLMSATVEKQYEIIATGKCGMIFQVGFVLGDINAKYPEGMKDLGFFPIPSDTDEGIAGVYLPNQLFGFRSDMEEATKEFINFMASVEAQNIWYAANPAVSAYSNVTVDSLFEPSNDFVKYVEANKAMAMVQMVVKPRFLEYDKITQNLIIGEYTPEQATEKMAESMLKDGIASKLPGFTEE